MQRTRRWAAFLPFACLGPRLPSGEDFVQRVCARMQFNESWRSTGIDGPPAEDRRQGCLCYGQTIGTLAAATRTTMKVNTRSLPSRLASTLLLHERTIY